MPNILWRRLVVLQRFLARVPLQEAGVAQRVGQVLVARGVELLKHGPRRVEHAQVAVMRTCICGAHGHRSVS